MISTAVSKSQQKAVHKYVKANYDRVELTVPKGQKDTLKAHAETHGESVNGFIGRAIAETMKRDSSGIAPESTVRGAVALPSETLEVAQRAAEAAGETLPVFITRAVSQTAERDSLSQNS